MEAAGSFETSVNVYQTIRRHITEYSSLLSRRCENVRLQYIYNYLFIFIHAYIRLHIHIHVYIYIYMYIGGKQWQTTPKNLPRMQCARAIPVT